MIDLGISFDAEDFVTPEAADARKYWADELHQRGIRGSFQLVAEVLRADRARERTDVIEAIRWHEIGYHTNKHSVPPTPPVALEGVGLAEGIPWVLQKEIAGWTTLVEEFGRAPISYCSPGDSWTPHVLLAFATIGVKVFCGGIRWGALSPCWYCGMLNVDYDLAFDSFMEDKPGEEERFKATFDSLVAKKGDGGLMVLYSHPTRLVTERFWDAPFYQGAHPPAPWPPAPLRKPQHIQTLKDRFRRCLDWIVARRDVRRVDFSTAYAERAGRKRRDLQSLLNECNLAPGQETLLPLRDPPRGQARYRRVLDGIRYTWAIYPKDFKGEKTLELARQLVWTAGPAKVRER